MHNLSFNPTVIKRLGLTLAVAGLLAACQQDDKKPEASAAVAESKPSAVAAPVTAPAPTTPAAVDGKRIVAADDEPGQWMSTGRTYDEQRHSPLQQINADNVKDLGLDWYFDYPTKRGMEATPIVVDGTLYTSGSWSIVYAFDAKSGKLLWYYDPQVPKSWMVNLCCDAVNRGVAVWNGKVYVGTLDGRLIALNAKDGAPVWEVQTTDKTKPYSITGAPRIVKGKVMIGNGGAELGVRGYISAYDAETGDMVWRFYTVPGDPAKPYESEQLAKAAETWTGDEYWKFGAGGTVWDSMAYDPELDLFYFGVGNGTPWNRMIRSPGGGDNLFVSSIVAVRPDTGEYVWHYQTTPGESWDYTATQHMILADLEIDGKPRKVIMQAPKNGFFYVLDRETGEFISAEKYTAVTWASHVDPETGRPVETENARYEDGPQVVFPNTQGGHNWHPMSYSPETGYVYIPAQIGLMNYANDDEFVFRDQGWNVGVDVMVAVTPEDKALREKVIAEFSGFMSAWDPVANKEAWRIPMTNMWNGGILSTAGNLLFQGNAEGELVAYRADSGKKLWSFPAYTGIVAAPITYTVDGEQYVAVNAGWGGALIAFGEIAGRTAKDIVPGGSNHSRLLVFKLGAKEQLPKPTETREIPTPPPLEADVEVVEAGHKLYMFNCHFCHGDSAVSGSSVPDLRMLSPQTHEEFYAIVLGGLRHNKGMAGFAGRLDKDDADAIHAYLIKRAHDLQDELNESESESE